jgi:hypothetical protein
VGTQTGKKRRGFTIRESNDKTSPAQRLREHRVSKGQIGDRKSGLVKDRLIAKLGPGKYGELLQQLGEAAGKDS